jgi:hypothetical protein
VSARATQECRMPWMNLECSPIHIYIHCRLTNHLLWIHYRFWLFQGLWHWF